MIFILLNWELIELFAVRPEQLTGIQCIIDAVSDHIEDGLSILHSLEHHDDDTNKGTNQ